MIILYLKEVTVPAYPSHSNLEILNSNEPTVNTNKKTYVM